MSLTVGAPGRRQIMVRAPIDVFMFVDELEVAAVGELVLGELGAVFVEAQRICWAAARGLARRLTELLVAEAGVDAAQVEQLYVRCRQDGVPIGQRLVADGLLRPDQLRAALLEHATESLLVLCREPIAGVWMPRRGRSYASQFTFTTEELLTQSLAHGRAELARRGRAVLTESLGEGDLGAAFVRGADLAGPGPVALVGPWAMGTRGVLHLGRWAASSVDVSQNGGDGGLIASTRGEATFVAWRAEGLVMAGITTELGAARLLARLASRRRAGRLSDGRL